MRVLTVVVWMVTYNHENFIQKAIESVMFQRTNFDFKLIIGEDFSKDNTRCICEKMKNKYPDKIELILQKQNIGSIDNAISVYNKCQLSKAKYMALLEGDDYWTDPLKLQKQVDFMEVNPDYNICFHEVDIFNQSENKIESNNITRNVTETTDINDLAQGNYIHTPSVVMRNNFTFPKWFNKTSIGDWSIYMIAAKNKKIKKLDEVMAVYRLHGSSLWATKSKTYRIVNTIKSIELLINDKDISLDVKKILKQNTNNLKHQLPKKPYSILSILKKIKKILND